MAILPIIVCLLFTDITGPSLTLKHGRHAVEEVAYSTILEELCDEAAVVIVPPDTTVISEDVSDGSKHPSPVATVQSDQPFAKMSDSQI
ncbi:hypothetical protein BDR05DRAFT_1004043 [Suillus weaverae]|nr:hypothetical protein BDR05DRAFT_1004043 [Suillus weaverae]